MCSTVSRPHTPLTPYTRSPPLALLSLGAGLTLRLRAGHIVDIPSFPFVSEVYPNLSSAGAFDPQHLYTPADVAGIVQYAKARGVRVVPEFEYGSTALRLTPRLSALG